MKILNKFVPLRYLTAAVLLAATFLVYSQSVVRTVKHTVSGDNTSGIFSVVSTDQQSFKNVKVQEISISVMNTTGKNVIISADLTELSDPKVSNTGVTAVVKSYSDPSYVRKEKVQKEEAEESYPESENNDEIEQEEDYDSDKDNPVPEEEKDPYENITDEDVPAKMYLEVKADGSESTFSFYDKNDLESIISGINNQYGTNFEVSGSGRNVHISRTASQRTEIKKEASKRVNIQKSEIESGSYSEILKFDIVKLESELLKDKILDKNKIKSYTVLIDKDDLYVNGNKVSDKLTAKYRKIFAKFSFDYSDD
ncbi:MAG TPA: hypothetical protein PLK90_08080 [Clostridiales bacterium]|nr:hypothetical protein [Clostridiales bacterium]HQP70341.1 hypothetical protein [Clostridiales bacterium]